MNTTVQVPCSDTALKAMDTDSMADPAIIAIMRADQHICSSLAKIGVQSNLKLTHIEPVNRSQKLSTPGAIHDFTNIRDRMRSGMPYLPATNDIITLLDQFNK